MRTNCRSFAFAQDDNLALSSRVSGATRDMLLILERLNPRSIPFGDAPDCLKTRPLASAQDDNLTLSSRVSGATRDLLFVPDCLKTRSLASARDDRQGQDRDPSPPGTRSGGKARRQDDKQRPLPSLVWDAAAKRHFRLDKSDATCIKYFRFHLACRMPHSKIQANAPLSGESSGADHVPFNADQGGPRRETDDFKAPRNEESQRKSLRRTPLRHPGGKDPPRHPPCGTYAGGEHGHQQDARP